MTASYNYYWPYAANEPIVHYQYFTCLGRTLQLSDGSSYYFGNVEVYNNPTDQSVSMIYYFCSTEPHTHPNLPSCSRFITCYPPGNSVIMIPWSLDSGTERDSKQYTTNLRTFQRWVELQNAASTQTSTSWSKLVCDSEIGEVLLWYLASPCI